MNCVNTLLWLQFLALISQLTNANLSKTTSLPLLLQMRGNCYWKQNSWETVLSQINTFHREGEKVSMLRHHVTGDDKLGRL